MRHDAQHSKHRLIDALPAVQWPPVVRPINLLHINKKLYSRQRHDG